MTWEDAQREAEEADVQAREALTNIVEWMRTAPTPSTFTKLQEALCFLERRGSSYESPRQVMFHGVVSAAKALDKVCEIVDSARVATNKQGPLWQAFKSLENACRDVVVLRGRLLVPAGDRIAFLDLMRHAFGEKINEAALLLSYRKRIGDCTDAFCSNNQAAASRRGWIRNRRQRGVRPQKVPEPDDITVEIEPTDLDEPLSVLPGADYGPKKVNW